MEFQTTAEVADRLRTAVGTLRYWRSVGEGPRSVKFGRRVMYRSEDVDAWIAARYNAEPEKAS